METTLYDIDRMRNIGFAAHIDAGKTTTTERILYYTKRIHRIGEVDNGTATTDWMIQEKERGITITSAATTCIWKGYRINIIDTPGHVDFTAEVERSLRVLDGLVVIFCGVAGVEPQSETVWHQADRYNVPRIVFINKLDRLGADPDRAIEMIEDRFNARTLKMQLPVGLEADFIGVIDVVEKRKYIWDIDETGETYRTEDVEGDPEVEKAYEELINKLSEVDEHVIKEFLEKGTVSPELVRKAIRKAVLKREFIPVFMGSALKNKGIQPLLDAIVYYLPSPKDIGEVYGINPFTGEREVRKADPEEPFSGVVFKIQFDRHAGHLAYTRVYSGTLKINKKVYNSTEGTKERVTRIFLMHADKKEQRLEAKAGEIVALAGFKNVKTGDTICDEEHPILFEGMRFPEPVVSVAVEPRSARDEEKLETTLQSLTNEDPTFKIKKDKETGQLLISGMGELHLEILVDRVKREFGIPVRVGKPEVSYRETIQEMVTIKERFDREIGGNREKGYVEIDIVPRKRGEGNRITVKPEMDPELKERLINAGIESLSFGPLLGYPVIDVEVIIKKISDERESTPLGLELALRRAVQEGLRKGKPVLLEPVVLVEVISPADYVGNIVSDLGQRGGELEGIEVLTERLQKVRAHVPLRKMLGYVTDLRSITQGRGNFWMKLVYFSPLKKEDVETKIWR